MARRVVSVTIAEQRDSRAPTWRSRIDSCRASERHQRAAPAADRACISSSSRRRRARRAAPCVSVVQAEKRAPASSSDISPSMSPARASARRALLAPGLDAVDGERAVEHDHHEVALLVLADHLPVGRHAREIEKAAQALQAAATATARWLVVGAADACSSASAARALACGLAWTCVGRASPRSRSAVPSSLRSWNSVEKKLESSAPSGLVSSA